MNCICWANMAAAVFCWIRLFRPLISSWVFRWAGGWRYLQFSRVQRPWGGIRSWRRRDGGGRWERETVINSLVWNTKSLINTMNWKKQPSSDNKPGDKQVVGPPQDMTHVGIWHQNIKCLKEAYIFILWECVSRKLWVLCIEGEAGSSQPWAQTLLWKMITNFWLASLCNSGRSWSCLHSGHTSRFYIENLH